MFSNFIESIEEESKPAGIVILVASILEASPNDSPLQVWQRTQSEGFIDDLSVDDFYPYPEYPDEEKRPSSKDALAMVGISLMAKKPFGVKAAKAYVNISFSDFKQATKKSLAKVLRNSLFYTISECKTPDFDSLIRYLVESDTQPVVSEITTRHYTDSKLQFL